ncbi:WXG100 family type VII secretion target [Embleya sp. NPDC050493]|uniref:WXG100 family type VII secretion target n=1 Tax=Embleya sp. NPDC050493 TaxID=3363989 RepID=UPI003799AD75
MKDDILRVLDPGRDSQTAGDPVSPPARATGTSITAGKPLRVTPELVQAAATALEGLRGEFSTVATQPGESAESAASGLPGWETAAALLYVAQRWRSQSGDLGAMLSAGAAKLAEGARTYKDVDERSADEFAGWW